MNSLERQTEKRSLDQLGNPNVNVPFDITEIRREIDGVMHLYTKSRSAYEKHIFTLHFDGLQKRVDQELAKNHALTQNYEAIILRGDQEKLRDHTVMRKTALWEFFKSSGRNLDHIEIFKEWIEGTKVVRKDPRKELSVFQSPEETGVISSFDPMDAFVRADRYVYASLDLLPHFMTGRNTNEHAIIDQDDMKDRSELVMMDAFNMSIGNPRFVETYLDNLFDYERGKEILTMYLAYVFDNADQAEAFFKMSEQLAMPMRWNVLSKSTPEVIAEVIAGATSDNFLEKAGSIGFRQFKNVTEAMTAFETANSVLTKVGIDKTVLVTIFKRIQSLEDQLNLKPPMNLEVRIKGRANVIR